MLHKTQGVVLSTINYNDKYILVQMFTGMFGRVTYMVSKTKSKSSRVSKSLFYPLSLLDLEVDHQHSRDIHRIREVRPLSFQHNISASIEKTSMVFFISEFLTRILKDTDESTPLFNFLNHSVQILEMTEHSIANYHLVFILKLSRFLGFYPNLEGYMAGDIFDMINGEFVSRQPLHSHYVNSVDSMALARLSRINYENMHIFAFSRQNRITIISRMLEYYRLHLHDFAELKSLDVLHELF